MNQKKAFVVFLIIFFLKDIVTLAQSENYIWDLSPLLSSEEAWETEKTVIENKIIELKKYEGTLGKNAESLADALDAVYELRARTGKMYMYGLLNYEVHANSDKALQQYDISTAFDSKVESAVAFIRGEIKNIGENKIKEWIKKEPRLEKHKIRLNRIIYESPYTLSNESQKVLESVLRWPRLSVDAYDKFYNSDLGWSILKGMDGKEIVADPGAYNEAIRGPKNPDREKIINMFLQKLKILEDPFGILFTRRVEADLTIAKNRGFNGGMDAIWYLRDGMPVGSYKLAIEVSQSTLPTLNKYLKLRSQVLGVDRMSFADIFTRTKLKKRFTIQETFDNYYNASKIFGAEYQNKLKERIKKPWMHLVDSDEKSGTYGIFPPVDDSPPYILMNYRETLASSRALAGALGLMMAFEDIAEVHPSDTRDDPGITSNAYIYVSNLLYYE
ncbi:MAG: oligoendopeptidase F family protein, partial [Melioribacteraceae bacterium]